MEVVPILQFYSQQECLNVSRYSIFKKHKTVVPFGKTLQANHVCQQWHQYEIGTNVWAVKTKACVCVSAQYV